MKHLLPLLLLLAASCSAPSPDGRAPRIVERIAVDSVPADFPVEFALFTRNGHQVAAYYDTRHQLTVAARTPGQETWQYRKLPTFVPWDSHNYIALYIDDEGYIHLAGNMHVDSLKYFRSAQPYDIGSMERMPMLGQEEERTTYPAFMRSPKGELVFHYRHGGSGNGYEIYNVWDAATRTWRRLSDRPLIDGLGERNAYMEGPTVGPDGYYHLVWVWRETPDCSTNHTLSYARSRDLVHWESIDGVAVGQPILLADSVLYVDDIPVNGGIINGGAKLGFDHRNRPVIAYHKFDAAGNTQLYLTRFDEGAWRSVQQTDWAYRWEFSGWGSIDFELTLDPPFVTDDGRIAIEFDRRGLGKRRLTSDAETLAPLGDEPQPARWPEEIAALRSEFDGMMLHTVRDGGALPDGTTMLLRWETMPPNRDKRRTDEVPLTGVLELYRLER